MSTKKPTIFEIKDTIVTCLTTKKLPEKNSDYETFLTMTLHWANQKPLSSKQTDAWNKIKRKFRLRCSNTSDVVIWNELHRAMKEVSDAYRENINGIRQQEAIIRQAATKVKDEIEHADTTASDIFSLAYLQDYFPQFTKGFATE